ncbi:thioesterase domain-containing protein [Aquabacter spiritensis]|uniref:Thioesterase domain-containing protein n=1 Tax=Aquabacter spiritensis TaxID=933073 RepID=A0A4R3M5P2_9HYPH|nr:thioesterase domain-containing protein [Aquabacter spiritensis]TCT06787.1 hypothetical protein EDC64_102267 [Aquabacter spiritensis]
MRRGVFALAVWIGTTLPTADARGEVVGRVYLMRGIANVFSYGLDDLADRLGGAGIAAEVHPFGTWPELARAAVAWSRGHDGAPVAVIGHSLGADAALRMAARMTELGVPPSLVITFDPVGTGMVEEAQGRFVNYFQSDNGYGRPLVDGPGFRGKIENHDLSGAPGLDHFNLEKSPDLHAAVLDTLLATLPARPVAAVPLPPVKPRNPHFSRRSLRDTARGRNPPASAGPSASAQAGPMVWGQIRQTRGFE